MQIRHDQGQGLSDATDKRGQRKALKKGNMRGFSDRL